MLTCIYDYFCHRQVVDSGEDGPPRCQRCKAYVNPFTHFTDNGDKFRCNFCSHSNMTPPSYVCALNHDGTRLDKYDRPELCCGSVEFIATKEYMVCCLQSSMHSLPCASCEWTLQIPRVNGSTPTDSYTVNRTCWSTASMSEHHIHFPVPDRMDESAGYHAIAATNTWNV